MQLAYHSHHENVGWGRLILEEIRDIVKDRWFWGVLALTLLAAALVALMVIFAPSAEPAPGTSPYMPLNLF